MSYVASGRFDLYWEYAEPPLLDRIAGMLLVQEAGGRVTDCAGAPFNFLKASYIPLAVLIQTARPSDEARCARRRDQSGMKRYARPTGYILASNGRVHDEALQVLADVDN